MLYNYNFEVNIINTASQNKTILRLGTLESNQNVVMQDKIVSLK